MNPDERMARIEQQLEQIADCLSRTTQTVATITARMESVARLEERYVSMDNRIESMQVNEERRLNREEKVRDIIFDRIRNLENSSGLNSHGRDMIERYMIPLAAALSGGLIMYIIQAEWIVS